MRRAAVLLLAVLLQGAALPPDLIPPGAQRVTTSKDAVSRFDVALSPSKVDAFYRKALDARGWKAGASVTYGTTIVLDAHKPPKGVGRITITPKGNNFTAVTLSLSESQPR